MSAEEVEARRYGKFINTSGLVYSEFDENVHVIEPFDVPVEWQDNISIDPGLHNPLSAHFYAVDFDGNVYVVAEHFESEKDVSYHANCIKKIADRMNWKRNSSGKLSALIDPAASQRTLSSEKTVVELFSENGINVNTKVNKDMFSGIATVKSYLKSADGRVRLYIFKNCVNLIREFKSYWWGDGDNPIKKDDHALDELRYYLMTKPKNTPKVKKTEIQKDKERLARRLRLNR